MVIKDAGDMSPAPSYQEATTKYLGTASIDSDGALMNYATGRPFDPETFEIGSEEDGWKWVWNWL